MTHDEQDAFPYDPDAETEAKELAARFSVHYVDLRTVDIPDRILALVPRDIAMGERIVPISDDGTSLVIVLSDPTDRDFRDKLQFILNRRITAAVAPPSYINAAIKWYYRDNA